MARTALPPGFRFHPTDVELVMYYLKRKVMGKRLHFEPIAEVNIYKFSPWDLPDKSCLKSKDLEWFFFCPRERKYACGDRMKRGTENGYWKTTGKDRPVHYNENVVGMVRTLVFHRGRASQGQRTNWVIHEYRILDEQLAAAGLQDIYVLCKVFQKNGLGPKNGAQYGAPFNEADWDDDHDDDVQNHVTSLPSDGPSLTASTLPENQNCSVITSMVNPGSKSGQSIEIGPSHFSGPSVTDDSVLLNENGNHGKQADLNQKGKNKYLPCLDGNEIYNGLWDLDNWDLMNECRLDFTGLQKDGYPLNYTLPQDDSTYLELNDLDVPLNRPAEVNEMEQMQFENFFIPFAQGDTEQLIFGGNFSGMDEYASCLGHLPVPPEGSNQQGSCSDVLQMKDGYPLNYTLPQDDSTYLELNDLDVPLNRPAEVNEMEQMQFDNFFIPFAQGDTEQLIFGGNFSGMDEYASCLGHLPVPPERSNQQGSCSDVLQMEISQCDCGYNATAQTLNFTSGDSEEWANFV